MWNCSIGIQHDEESFSSNTGYDHNTVFFRVRVRYRHRYREKNSAVFALDKSLNLLRSLCPLR